MSVRLNYEGKFPPPLICSLATGAITVITMHLPLALLLVIFTTTVTNGAEDIVVRARVGQIRGLQTTTPRGTRYFSFRGIPYAEPPVEDRRFQTSQTLEQLLSEQLALTIETKAKYPVRMAGAPLEISGWEGVFNGTDDGPVCPQLHIATNQVIGDENCLHLNVYTTNVIKGSLDACICPSVYHSCYRTSSSAVL